MGARLLIFDFSNSFVLGPHADALTEAGLQDQLPAGVSQVSVLVGSGDGQICSGWQFLLPLLDVSSARCPQEGTLSSTCLFMLLYLDVVDIMHLVLLL